MSRPRTRYLTKDNIEFDLVDEETVERLSKDKKVVLPKRKLEIPKDKRWNEKQLSSKLLQGILNGDSIPVIAEKMLRVVFNNEVSAMRNARTMTTSAECHGRLDSYNRLAIQGVVQKKVWTATADDRTRKSHIDIDGEEQDIDKEFSNGCMYPGDGHGPADEVWNCRCSMRDHIVGFRRKDGSISYVDYRRDKTLHDEQIAKERNKRRAEAKSK